MASRTSMSATWRARSLPAGATTPKHSNGKVPSECCIIQPREIPMTDSLSQFAADILSGGIQIIDLTQTLSPEFPTIALPPEFGQCAPFRLEEISRYDGRGPAWYWHNFYCGEHTGTHFDAPLHWVSGKDLPDNTTDTIPARNFIAPACVIDCSREAGENADLILT